MHGKQEQTEWIDGTSRGITTRGLVRFERSGLRVRAKSSEIERAQRTSIKGGSCWSGAREGPPSRWRSGAARGGHRGQESRRQEKAKDSSHASRARSRRRRGPDGGMSRSARASSARAWPRRFPQAIGRPGRRSHSANWRRDLSESIQMIGARRGMPRASIATVALTAKGAFGVLPFKAQAAPRIRAGITVQYSLRGFHQRKHHLVEIGSDRRRGSLGMTNSNRVEERLSRGNSWFGSMRLAAAKAGSGGGYKRQSSQGNL